MARAPPQEDGQLRWMVALLRSPRGRFLREVRQVWGLRLGRTGRGRQVLPEDLTRRAIAEAAAGGVVEPVGEAAGMGPRERLGRALARQEAAGGGRSGFRPPPPSRGVRG